MRPFQQSHGNGSAHDFPALSGYLDSFKRIFAFFMFAMRYFRLCKNRTESLKFNCFFIFIEQKKPMTGWLNANLVNSKIFH